MNRLLCFCAAGLLLAPAAARAAALLLGETYGEARFMMNKGDLQLLNLILNYDF